MGSGHIAPFILNLVQLDRVSDQKNGRPYAGYRALVFHWIKGCVGLRARLEILDKTQMLLPMLESEPQIGQAVASLLYGLRYGGSRLKQETPLIQVTRITVELIRLMV
jgi:hypothetical protein